MVLVEGSITFSRNCRRRFRVHLGNKILVRIDKIFKMSVCVTVDA